MEKVATLTSLASPYEIIVNMPAQTVRVLNEGNYRLYAFKAIQSSGANAYPVVWCYLEDIFAQTRVSWTEQYQAYVSTTVNPTTNTVIAASTSTPIDLGQRAAFEGGAFDVSQGNPGVIAIRNDTTTEYTCGLAQPEGGSTSFNPICAFQLLPSTEDAMVPVEKVLLMFATERVETGTVLERSYSWGALIDLAEARSISVEYDLTVQNRWVQQPNVDVYPPDSDLLPLLVNSTPGS